MKMIAIGDFHGKLPQKIKNLIKKQKIDIILSTGDFGGSKKLLNIVFKYFHKDWWTEVGKKRAKQMILEDYNSGKNIINQLNQLNIPIYTVHGNWDFETRVNKRRHGNLKLKNYSEIMKKKKNITFLKQKNIKLNKNINLYGFGGMVTASIYTTKESGFDKETIQKIKKQHEKLKQQLFKKAKPPIDILLTHYPPYNYFDKVKYKKYNPMNNKHIGFKPYNQFIKKHKPKLMICGHMHEYQGKKKLNNTLIISTGSAQQGKAVIIDIDENNKDNIKVKFIK